MTEVIFKYTLGDARATTVLMPEGAEILHYGNQYGVMTIWAKVNPNNPVGTRKFLILGTGDALPEFTLVEYIGTAQFSEGRLVWHLYEILKE